MMLDDKGLHKSQMKHPNDIIKDLKEKINGMYEERDVFKARYNQAYVFAYNQALDDVIELLTKMEGKP